MLQKLLQLGEWRVRCDDGVWLRHRALEFGHIIDNFVAL
jgi:hypothetical protein